MEKDLSIMLYLIPSPVELQATVLGEEQVLVWFSDGDGRVPVLSDEDGCQISYSEFRQFLSDCCTKGSYPLLCVESAKKAWLIKSRDSRDEMRLNYCFRNQELVLTEA